MVSNFPAGKEINKDAIQKFMADTVMGSTPGTVWGRNDSTFLNAYTAGNGDDWLPDVSEVEAQQIRGMIKADPRFRGQAWASDPSMEAIQEYKKFYIIGVSEINYSLLYPQE